MPPPPKPKPAPWPRERLFSLRTGFATAPKDFHLHDLCVPCQTACPAGTDVPAYLEAVWRDDFAAAYRLNLRDNVFPAVLGRVCTRPCEPACRHGQRGNGEPVAICFAKRSSDDFRRRPDAPEVLPPLFPPSGQSVGVIGAGAAGLTAARELARAGHAVTVYERAGRAGGLMTRGIPAFRLPADLARREVEQVLAQGITLRTGVAVGETVRWEELAAAHQALVVATGCAALRRPDWPGAEGPGVEHGLPYLQAAADGAPPPTGRHVLVIGGGFTAVDAARLARRLGATSVTLACRRRAEDLYIDAAELHQFALEGVQAEFGAQPVAILREGGAVTGVRFLRTRPGAPAADGRPAAEAVPGTEFTLAADQVLLCTGQAPDPRPFAGAENDPRVFFAGDLATGPGSLIQAVGHAKAVARRVDAALMGSNRYQDGVRVDPVPTAATGRPRERNAIRRFPMPEIAPAERFRAPDLEVETGLGRGESREEAGRCYFCNHVFEIDNELCIYCDRCLKVTPVEGCIVKISGLNFDAQDRVTGHTPATGARDYRALWIDQDKCIRCGACVEVCPVECIGVRRSARETRVQG
jgi:formate dehydrogenase major subunit